MRRLHVKSLHFQVKFLTLFGDIFTLVLWPRASKIQLHNMTQALRAQVLLIELRSSDRNANASTIPLPSPRLHETVTRKKKKPMRDELEMRGLSRGAGEGQMAWHPKTARYHVNLPKENPPPPLTCCSNSLAIVWCYMQCNTRTKATQTKFWDFFIWANQMSSKNEMSKKSSWAIHFRKCTRCWKFLI